MPTRKHLLGVGVLDSAVLQLRQWCRQRKLICDCMGLPTFARHAEEQPRRTGLAGHRRDRSLAQDKAEDGRKQRRAADELADVAVDEERTLA